MTLITYNNIAIPSFMYGTAWKKEATSALVKEAVRSGFKAIDTANQLIHYQEALVGDALVELGREGVTRETLFLQTKFTSVNGQDHRTPYDVTADLTTQVAQSMDSSLAHLHVDFVDSYVLHGPQSRFGLAATDWEIWAAIENLYQSGKTRIIGISNVTAEQLAELCLKAKIKPMVVQNRCYASMGWDKAVREVCRECGVVYQGFSLLTANSKIMTSTILQSISRRLGASVAQVVFRFAMDLGMLPLTGTTNGQRMKEDLQAEQLSLTPEEITLVENMAL